MIHVGLCYFVSRLYSVGVLGAIDNQSEHPVSKFLDVYALRHLRQLSYQLGVLRGS